EFERIIAPQNDLEEMPCPAPANTGAGRKHRDGCLGGRSSRTRRDDECAVWCAGALDGLKPQRYIERRRDRNNSSGYNRRRTDVTQAAAMLAGVMRFLLIGV